MAFRELYVFSKWGQGLTTGVFEKDGREFVFVPGDTVTLGWKAFAVGVDKDSRAELREVFKEFVYQDSVEAFLRESMSLVHQVAVPPMLVGRKLKEIGWERVVFRATRLQVYDR